MTKKDKIVSDILCTGLHIKHKLLWYAVGTLVFLDNASFIDKAPLQKTRPGTHENFDNERGERIFYFFRPPTFEFALGHLFSATFLPLHGKVTKIQGIHSGNIVVAVVVVGCHQSVYVKILHYKFFHHAIKRPDSLGHDFGCVCGERMAEKAYTASISQAGSGGATSNLNLYMVR